MLVSQPLNAPNLVEARELYGVEFVEPSQLVLDEFRELCGRLVCEQASSMTAHGLDPALQKPAIWFEPVAFLARPLTVTQTKAINERETPAVADYCVSVQSQLRNVPIEESGEPLMHLPALFDSAGLNATFSTIPFPDVAGEWAGKPQEFWARTSLAKRLQAMGELVNSCGVSLHFIEAFRPVGVQEGMFKRRVFRTQQEHPNWTSNQVISEAQSKTASSPRLASHKGGAAVDLLLQNSQTSKLLDFGHDYPDGGVLVFPRTPYVTANQWRNRQLLQVSAGLCGLTLYVGEDWHVSYGDNLAGLDETGHIQPDYKASFGPIKDFDRSTGSIIEKYGIDELDQTFSI